jgi:hypothetical protein
MGQGGMRRWKVVVLMLLKLKMPIKIRQWMKVKLL